MTSSSISDRPKCDLFVFGARLVPGPQNIKNKNCPNPSKSQKISLDAKCFNFDAFLMPFGSPFSINFPDRLNLLICNQYNAKTSSLPFLASHFGIKNKSTNYICSSPLPGSHFSICSKTCRFWDPFKIQWAPERDHKSTSCDKMVSQTSFRHSMFCNSKNKNTCRNA